MKGLSRPVGDEAKLECEELARAGGAIEARATGTERRRWACLLYTSDAADDLPCVAFGGRRIMKKTNNLIY